MNQKEEAFRLQLEQSYTWPSIYMFKFICPADNETIARVESLFDAESSRVTLRSSRSGNFTSITATELMISAESVLERYRKAAEIQGLLSL